MRKHYILPIILLISLLLSSCSPSSKKTTVDNTTERESLVKDVTAEQLQEWRLLTDHRISEIQTTPNMEIPNDALVYYISNNGDDSNDGLSQEKAWKTYKNLDKIQENSYVLFERGGTWRGQIILKNNVTYSAYGDGPKPNLYASLFNGADPELWSETEIPNVWKIMVGKESAVSDVGFVICDENLGSKVITTLNADGTSIDMVSGYPFASPADLRKDLQFFFNVENKGYTAIYMYSEGNPGDRFESIEFGVTKNIMYAVSLSNVTVDNLAFAYTGAHGFGIGPGTNITVQNCTFKWIGGGLQPDDEFTKNKVRYGNAIEIYGCCDGFYVKNNYLYQIYDSGITCQYRPSIEARYMLNQEFTDNVIEYSNSPFENFLHTTDDINDPTRESTVINYLVARNITWNVGEGLCRQRPLYGGSNFSGSKTRLKNYIIKDNLFIKSDHSIFGGLSPLINVDGSDSSPKFINNTFVQSKDKYFGYMTHERTTLQAFDDYIIDALPDGSYDNNFFAYPDNSEQTKAIDPQYETIKFGKYEQDGNLENGPEDIEWYVLERDNDKALIISKYVLDRYDAASDRYSNKIWSNSIIRNYLNHDFLLSAFSKSESSKILTTHLTMGQNPDYPSDSGPETDDKIFHLNYEELIKYFPSNETRICCPTTYAHENKGVIILSSNGATNYPLRTIGITQMKIICVSYYGDINTRDSSDANIRPAMWIKLNSK